MMAVFPLDVEDALKAGIAKIQIVNQYNVERLEAGQIPIDLGVGIHTGHMMVGMIGEEDRIQGDAFSDNVNLTARIEGLTKTFGVSLIISAETLARIEEPGKYHMRTLGRVQVKGRETPIELFEVFDADPESTRRLKADTLEEYNEALKLYTLGNLSDALPLFERLVTLSPDDKTFNFYHQQVQRTLSEGIPDYWDSTIVMTKK